MSNKERCILNVRIRISKNEKWTINDECVIVSKRLKLTNNECLTMHDEF
jgi:hypothetical protein